MAAVVMVSLDVAIVGTHFFIKERTKNHSECFLCRRALFAPVTVENLNVCCGAAHAHYVICRSDWPQMNETDTVYHTSVTVSCLCFQLKPKGYRTATSMANESFFADSHLVLMSELDIII